MTDGLVSWGEFYDYMTCPYRFYLKQTTTVLPVLNKQAKELGTDFHKFAELYFGKLKDYTIVQMEEKKFEVEKFQRFHEFETRRRKWCEEKNIPWLPVYKEKEFSNGDWMCIVDRVDDNGDGTYTLVEYKTKPNQKDIQQLAYNYLVMKDSGIKVTMFMVYYAEFPEETYYKKPSSRSINSMVKKMSTSLPSIRSGLFLARPSGFTCTYCTYGAAGVCNKVGVNLHRCSICSGTEEGSKP